MAWSLACAATISRWTPASTSFASARVRPKSAMSTRPSGRLISTTSAHDPSPSAPISTSLKTQATYPPSVRERVRKYQTALAPPISRRSPLGQRTDADIPDRRRTPNLATVPFERGNRLLCRMQLVAGVRKFDHVRDGLRGRLHVTFCQQVRLFMLVT